MNIDLKLLCKWLKANKISLNASKTELIIFRDPRKKINYELKIKIDGKKLEPCNSVKYLGIQIDCHLIWKAHETILSSKLCRALGMLSKIRHYVDHNTLKMIYHGIFSSILLYSSLIWGQKVSIVEKLQIIQNKALRIINFQHSRMSATPLYKTCKILKLSDSIKLQNVLFAFDSINRQLPSPLNNLFDFYDTNYNTRTENLPVLKRLQTRTILYGSNSIKSKVVDTWNHFILNHMDNQHKSRSICKKLITNILLDRYEQP